MCYCGISWPNPLTFSSPVDNFVHALYVCLFVCLILPADIGWSVIYSHGIFRENQEDVIQPRHEKGTVPSIGMQCVIVVLPGHTHLQFGYGLRCPVCHCIVKCLQIQLRFTNYNVKQVEKLVLILSF